jgi:hypothetical protein
MFEGTLFLNAGHHPYEVADNGVVEDGRHGGSSRRAMQATNYLWARFFFLGIFAPALRASDRPIAMACLRFFTAPPK